MSDPDGRRKREKSSGNGGMAARRAVFRWGWRMYRREWRQQVLIVGLLSLAIAATVVTAAAAYNLTPSQADGEFGSANHFIQTAAKLPPATSADFIAAAEDWFEEIDVITRRRVPVPGSVDPVEIRTQDPKARSAVRCFPSRTDAIRPAQMKSP